MAIEITGVPDARGVEWLARVARRLIGVSVFITAVAAALSADALIRSYKFYSQVIDARLASGYLTSRPGLYAAPRVLQVGQKLSHDKLIQTLRRAGYLETSASNVGAGVSLLTHAQSRFGPAAAVENNRQSFELDLRLTKSSS